VRLHVQENAARAGVEDLGGHAGLPQRLDAVQHGPGVKGDARGLIVFNQRLDLRGTADGEGVLVVVRHPLDAVVRLEDDAQAVVSQAGTDLFRRSVR
jgi:hypothetical protein